MKKPARSSRNWLPEHAIGDLVEGPGGKVHEPGPVRHDQPAQQPRGKELGHAAGRVEQVEGVERRRRVNDQQVVIALFVELVKPFHCDVVVALGEPAA